jgi:peptidoglycan hydrolase-like protein with peptidoglycan-binding domain
MNKNLLIFAFVILISLFSLVALAEDEPEISADFAGVYSIESGDFIYEKGVDTIVYPASLVKIMTAVLALEYYESSGTDVEAVQTYLGVIAEVYTEIIPPEVSGDYDVATENAVRTLQGLFGLPQSGVVGPITWELIAEKYSEIENGKLRAEFQYPGDTIS